MLECHTTHTRYIPSTIRCHGIYIDMLLRCCRYLAACRHRTTDTAFRQQRMDAIQPIVTPAWVVGLFVAVGMLFVPFGTWLNLKYAKVVEIEQRYEGVGATSDDCSISRPNQGKEVNHVQRPNYIQQHITTYVLLRSWCLMPGTCVLAACLV